MIDEMTEAEMMEELRTWDQDVWERFKRENYECICFQFEPLEEPLETRLTKVKIGKYWLERK